jgi:tRNA A-37 threonylcarbamoyl transferase component Bud32
MEGRTLGRYKLIEEIGQGGMAVVYRGVDTTLQREVAVKILHPHLSRKESNRLRFAREARVVATLHHDNIVEIYDFSGGEGGDAGGSDAYIVTEYIRGRTLADFIEKTPEGMPVEIGVLVVVEICEAVAHAHAAGVVHRDIKPENVMIRQDGVLKLMDFGIARVNDDSGATMTGTLMGSPQYMSPEQVAGGELDARSDLFSIGILLYRLVAGVLPFEGTNPAAILRSILETQPVPADQKNPLVGRDLSSVIKRTLSKDPSGRYDGAAAMRDALLASIADAGLGSARDELRAYFADPAGYARQLNAALVARYAAAGHAKAKRRDAAGAMELWSRVLELDPGNVEVRRALETYGRGRRHTRVVRVGSLAVLGILAAGGGARAAKAWLDAHPAPRPTSTAFALATTAVTVATTPVPVPSASPAVTARTSGTPLVRSSPAAFVNPTPRASPLPSALPNGTAIAMIVPSPSPSPTYKPGPGMGALFLAVNVASEIFVDDVDIGPNMQLKNKPIELEAEKTHSVVIRPVKEAIGCEPLEGSVVVPLGKAEKCISVNGAGGKTDRLCGFDGSLYLRGCTLRFTMEFHTELGDPPILKEVLIDDQPAKMDKDETWHSTSGRHTLSVKTKNYAVFKQEIELRPQENEGKPNVVPIKLEPTAKAPATP